LHGYHCHILEKMSAEFISIAKGEVGKVEIPLGSNWGPHVKKYLASVGLNFPASWCMAFVVWCIDQECARRGIANTLPRTGGVLKFWNEAPAQRRVQTPKVGDIFIMDYGKGLGHTGIVVAMDQTFIYTIEGNTNDSGSREGIEVCHKQRPRNKIKGYVRPF
jgi:hypothetical protein